MIELRKLSVFGVLAVVGAAHGQVWDLAGDWAPTANPNGVWQYGQMVGGTTFTDLAWDSSTASYGVGTSGNVFVYQNDTGSLAYGIQPGDISLESDWGDAAVQFTAPTTATYNFYIAMGGTLASSGGGFGNNFADFSMVSINGTTMSTGTFAHNTRIWDFSEMLAAGSTVDAYVINPGYALGGNTNTVFSVNSVPEPAPFAALGLGSLLVMRRRKSA